MLKTLAATVLLLLAWASFQEARACSPTPMTDAERFDHAATVFFARIVDTARPLIRLPWSDPFPTVVGRFELIETFKGKPPVDQRMRDDRGSCSLDLVPGVYYIFFASEGNSPPASSPAGSRGYTEASNPELLQMLDKLRELAKR